MPSRQRRQRTRQISSCGSKNNVNIPGVDPLQGTHRNEFPQGSGKQPYTQFTSFLHLSPYERGEGGTWPRQGVDNKAFAQTLSITHKSIGGRPSLLRKAWNHLRLLEHLGSTLSIPLRGLDLLTMLTLVVRFSTALSSRTLDNSLKAGQSDGRAMSVAHDVEELTGLVPHWVK